MTYKRLLQPDFWNITISYFQQQDEIYRRSKIESWDDERLENRLQALKEKRQRELTRYSNLRKTTDGPLWL